VRAIPGTYTVTMNALGQNVSQSATVRMDPRITVSSDEMRDWHREATTIERTDCRLDRAVAELAAIDQELTTLEGKADPQVKERVAAARRELRPIVLALRGDSRDPGHINLPGRLNWLTIQVGNYSGRPTRAQSELIAQYAQQTDTVIASLEALKKGTLASLRTK
jgi:hypothetical protein